MCDIRECCVSNIGSSTSLRLGHTATIQESCDVLALDPQRANIITCAPRAAYRSPLLTPPYPVLDYQYSYEPSQPTSRESHHPPHNVSKRQGYAEKPLETDRWHRSTTHPRRVEGDAGATQTKTQAGSHPDGVGESWRRRIHDRDHVL